MIDFMKRISVEAGKISLDEYSRMGEGCIDFKSEKDIVTSADRRVEEYLVSAIKGEFPGHGILAEESGASLTESEHIWIIDPIDGTTSFVHGQPFYSISLALSRGGETICGVVCAPRLGELYWAERGKGAYCNGELIRVSTRDRLINSVLSTGFACVRQNLPENNIGNFCRVLPEVRGMRRFGSAAMDLAYVASGRLDGFWELNLNDYDVAAGALLVTESGGAVCDIRGGADYPRGGIVATNGKITDELLALLG